MGRNESDLSDYLASLRPKLRTGGQILVVEIERTDYMFARIFFEDIRKISKPPGMSSKELENTFSRAGFDHVTVLSKSGLLYGLAH
jgi:hypothetical protein